MIAFPLWLVPAVPLAVLVLFPVPALRLARGALVPLAALPALFAALADPVPASLRLDWLLLGTEFALTETGRSFLAFAALLWALAGWQAVRLLSGDPRRDRFLVFFLLAMAGNLGLLIAQDIASFYAFFALMSLSSWGLVLHGQGAAQVFAGRVYIGFAMAGEVALFAGLAFGAAATGDLALSGMASAEVPTLATALMASGLLVKLGAVPLHLWLPLAHAAAPAPASAVLSGAMLKAGLFGLMIILPLGGAPQLAAATALAAMALSGLVIAPALGLVQGDPKAVLAYSSVGQMSLMALGLAGGLAAPEAWPVIAPALVLLAAHHAFSKAALFLGVPAVWATSTGPLRYGMMAVLALPALALAGLPATSGWMAKDALKSALGGVPAGWQIWLGTALFVASLGTALLMLRALVLLARAERKPDVPTDVTVPALAAAGLVVVGLWIVPITPHQPKPADLAALAPLLLAASLALAGLMLARFGRLRLAAMPPGELFALIRVEAAPEPVLALPGPVRPSRALAPRRQRDRLPRPEQGALALLGIAAVLAIVFAVTPPSEAKFAPPVPVETG